MSDEKEIVAGNIEYVVSEANRGFSRDQMVLCDLCLRHNAPTRVNCLYCGEKLPVTEATAALQTPTLKKLEEWEEGFNVILVPDNSARNTSHENLSKAAGLLRMETGHLVEMVDTRTYLPLARVATHDEAALIERRLHPLGLEIEIINDEELRVGQGALKRLRNLTSADEQSLTVGFAVGEEPVSVKWSDVMLVISGRLFTKSIEVEERRGLKSKKQIIDAREMAKDEAVLDIYATTDQAWRIESVRFDFSCLGAQKSLLAHENYAALVGMLKERAHAARFDDSYWSVRHLLVAAWPLAEHTESRGLRRERPGRFTLESATTMNNQQQWTRYSRLNHYFEQRGREYSKR